MHKTYIQKMHLCNYRNFVEKSLNLDSKINIIVGPNGVGKTNILESISLLSPGRGLKSVNFNDICHNGANNWRSNFRMQSKIGSAEIDSSFLLESKARKIHYNGSKIPSNELINLLNVIWLTPQMESLFLGPANIRRNFLDRIVFNFDKTHAKNITKYEHFVRERGKVLFSQNTTILSEKSWLESLEEKISIEALKIFDARNNIVSIMQNNIDLLDTEFPKAHLSISALLDPQIKLDDFIEQYRSTLEQNRQQDAHSHRTNFGIHKSDFLVLDKKQNRLAKLCSTGEQKALLISIMISSIESILRNNKTTPILLLDELFVHLDDIRRKHLIKYINDVNLQTFITTTDILGIEELSNQSNIVEL